LSRNDEGRRQKAEGGGRGTRGQGVKRYRTFHRKDRKGRKVLPVPIQPKGPELRMSGPTARVPIPGWTLAIPVCLCGHADRLEHAARRGERRVLDPLSPPTRETKKHLCASPNSTEKVHLKRKAPARRSALAGGH